MFASFFLFLALTAPPPSALAIDVAPGVTCPTRAAIEAAITSAFAGRLPAGLRARLAVEPPPPSGGHATSVDGTPESALLRLRIYEPHVRPPGWGPRVNRLVEARPGRCATTAQAIALVFERHVREIGWSAAAPSATDTVVATPRAADPADRPFVPPRLMLLGGPSLASGRARQLSASMELRARVGGLLSAGLGVALPEAQREPLPGGGEVRLTAWPWVARALVTAGPASLHFHAAVDALFTMDRGESYAISAPRAGRRFMFGAGGSLGAAWRSRAGLHLELEAGAARVLAGRDFVITGLGPVLPAPLWQGRVAARVGWALLP